MIAPFPEQASELFMCPKCGKEETFQLFDDHDLKKFPMFCSDCEAIMDLIIVRPVPKD